MPGKPAARVGDLTAHGTPLSIGPGSPNVFIGKRPAWRGITAAQATQLAQFITEATKKIAEASARAAAAAGTPAAPAATANHLKTLVDSIKGAASLMQSFAADIHTCPVVKVLVPDGAGVVIDGSQTVLINHLAACRMGDTIQETTSTNKITQGEFTVKIGG